MTAVFSQTIGHFAVPHVSTLLCVVLLSLRAHMAPYSTVTPSPSKYSAWQAAKKMLRCDRQQLGGASLLDTNLTSVHGVAVYNLLTDFQAVIPYTFDPVTAGWTLTLN